MSSERKVATVFGGSGFVGRYVVGRLAKLGYIVRVGVRDIEGAKFLKPLGDLGQVVLLYAPVTNEADVTRAVAGAEIVINLAGSLKGDLGRTNGEGAGIVARLARAAGVKTLVHVSAIGADAAGGIYAQSKAAGEAAVRAAFPEAAILRPSVIFGVEDRFFNKIAALAVSMPVLPVVHGATKLQPVYVGDVAEAVLAACGEAARGRVFELGGPEVKSIREIAQLTLDIIERQRPIWNVPVFFASLPGSGASAAQLSMLARDNVVADGAACLESLGVTPRRMDLVLPSYLARYRVSGKGHDAVFQE